MYQRLSYLITTVFVEQPLSLPGQLINMNFLKKMLAKILYYESFDSMKLFVEIELSQVNGGSKCFTSVLINYFILTAIIIDIEK